MFQFVGVFFVVKLCRVGRNLGGCKKSILITDLGSSCGLRCMIVGNGSEVNRGSLQKLIDFAILEDLSINFGKLCDQILGHAMLT